MMRGGTPLGAGLYFIDILACLLFCLVLALVGARFGREQSVDLDLPELTRESGEGASLVEREIALRETDGGFELWLDGESVDLPTLAARLREETPPAITVRSEASMLSRVIGVAHDAGVAHIELAYELDAQRRVDRDSTRTGGR